MSEITEVLRAIESLSERGERMALATVVEVKGSTYRRPGARLLVPEHGDMIGNISGGCLEGDIADVARIVMSEGRSRIASWDLTADDDAVWGLGLGCNGAIQVFVEPAEKAAEVARALRAALEDGQPICVVTVLDSAVPGTEQGGRLLVRSGGGTDGTLGEAGLDAAGRDAALELLALGRSEVRTLLGPAGGTRAFVEVLEPPLRVLVCGAGHDAIPLVKAVTLLGGNPIVVDDRPAFLTEERFPEASKFVLVERPDDAAGAAPVDEWTYVVVMTHNFLRDKEYLRSFLTSPVAYIGMLGPAARTQRLLFELRQEGVDVTERDAQRIHSPVGLDLGAEGPEEIAQAIVAEILSVKRRRGAGFLRDREGPIHDRR